MTDHHDFADHHFDDDHHDPLPSGEDEHVYQQPDEHAPAWDDDEGLPDLHHDGLPDLHHDMPDLFDMHAEEAATHIEDHVEVTVPEHDISEMSDEVAAADVFPPAVDVGDLPEPVDGFPWIDSGSLGLADIARELHDADAGTDPVQPHELAEYAATELPPGADPWAALADSEDPATSALARWWAPGN
jgi:hypothetical protein